MGSVDGSEDVDRRCSIGLVSGGLEVAEGGLRIGEVQAHEATRGVVDVDQQGACRRATLEPVVIAAIDLNQFADAIPAVAWLIDRREPQPVRYPEARNEHKLADCFLGQHDAVHLTELLSGERWAEVLIALADDRQRARGHAGRWLEITWLAAFAQDQATAPASM